MPRQTRSYRPEDYRQMDGEELCLCLEQADENAFNEVYQRYWAILYRHALRITKDEQLAEDSVQDVFVSLLRRCREHTFAAKSIKGYLYIAVRNRILDLIAAQKTREDHLPSFMDFANQYTEATDHQIRERQLALKIEREISFLPEKMRQIFELHRKEHLTYKEIAEQLDISDKTVKKQVSNALHILRQRLQLVMIFFGF